MKDKVPEEELRKLVGQVEAMDHRNTKFFMENLENIQEEHAGETIAIIDGEIVATLEGNKKHRVTKFLNKLRHEYGSDTVADAFITYVSEPDEVMVL